MAAHSKQVQAQLTLNDLSKKVFISKLPPNTAEEFVEKLLSSCGQIKSWTRYKLANGEPKDGGIVEYDKVEGVFTCLKFIHNL